MSGDIFMTMLLKKIPLFSSLKEEELKAIQKAALTKKFPKDNIILLEDEEGDTLFIILTGKVKFASYSETG